MAKLTKTKKQLTVLGGLLALIIGVVIWVSSGGGIADLPPAVFTGKTIDTDITDEIFENSEFKKLKSPVALPLTPGAAGRENPFAAIE